MKNISVDVKEIKKQTEVSEGTGRFAVNVSLSLYTIPEKLSLTRSDKQIDIKLHYFDDYAKATTVKYSDKNFDFFVTKDEGVLTLISIREPLPEEIANLVFNIEKALSHIQLKPSSRIAVEKTLNQYQSELTDYITSKVA